jgi:hypothetical protein
MNLAALMSAIHSYIPVASSNKLPGREVLLPLDIHRILQYISEGDGVAMVESSHECHAFVIMVQSAQ